MSRDLRKYAIDPKSAVRTAKQLYDSKKQITLLVEGLKDKRFYNQYGSGNLRIQELSSKDGVLEAFNHVSSKLEYCGQNYIHFLVDIDHDFLLNKNLITNHFFNYHVWDVKSQKGYNDLETYLISSNALEKFLVNYDIPFEEIPTIRKNLLESSSYIGAFRYADDLIQIQEGFVHSILDGMSLLEEWFDQSMIVNQKQVCESISKRLRQNSCVDLLIRTAQKAFDQRTSEYQLCRGHDLSEILSIGINKRKRSRLNSDNVELNLRLAAEKEELNKSLIANFSFWNIL